MSAITIQFKNSLSLFFFPSLLFILCFNEINAVKQVLPVAWLEWKTRSLSDQGVQLLTHLAQTVEIQYFSLHHRDF